MEEGRWRKQQGRDRREKLTETEEKKEIMSMQRQEEKDAESDGGD